MFTPPHSLLRAAAAGLSSAGLGSFCHAPFGITFLNLISSPSLLEIFQRTMRPIVFIQYKFSYDFCKLFTFLPLAPEGCKGALKNYVFVIFESKIMFLRSPLPLWNFLPPPWKKVCWLPRLRLEWKVKNQSHHEEDSLKLHQLIVDDPDLHRIPDVSLGELRHEVWGRSFELCDGLLQVPQRHVILLEKLSNKKFINMWH